MSFILESGGVVGVVGVRWVIMSSVRYSHFVSIDNNYGIKVLMSRLQICLARKSVLEGLAYVYILFGIVLGAGQLHPSM